MFLTLISVFIFSVNALLSYYNFVLIIRNVESHGEHTTNVPALPCHRISLLFVLYKRPDDGLVK
jgi:hypothetical protein